MASTHNPRMSIAGLPLDDEPQTRHPTSEEYHAVPFEARFNALQSLDLLRWSLTDDLDPTQDTSRENCPGGLTYTEARELYLWMISPIGLLTSNYTTVPTNRYSDGDIMVFFNQMRTWRPRVAENVDQNMQGQVCLSALPDEWEWPVALNRFLLERRHALVPGMLPGDSRPNPNLETDRQSALSDAVNCYWREPAFDLPMADLLLGTGREILMEYVDCTDYMDLEWNHDAGMDTDDSDGENGYPGLDLDCDLLLILCHKVPNPEDRCPICLEDTQGIFLAIDRCGHIFHEQCLRAWLKTSLQYNSERCPICRQDIVPYYPD